MAILLRKMCLFMAQTINLKTETIYYLEYFPSSFPNKLKLFVIILVHLILVNQKDRQGEPL